MLRSGATDPTVSALEQAAGQPVDNATDTTLGAGGTSR
jgi:hypothetical protein